MDKKEYTTYEKIIYFHARILELERMKRRIDLQIERMRKRIIALEDLDAKKK